MKLNRAIQKMKGEDPHTCVKMLEKKFGSLDFVPFKEEDRSFWRRYYQDNCMECDKNLLFKSLCCHFCWLMRGWLFGEKE